MSKDPDQKRDEAVEQSFPASDPPAASGITGASDTAPPNDKPSHERTMDERPTGSPTSDRHAVETAHQWEDQDQDTQRKEK